MSYRLSKTTGKLIKFVPSEILLYEKVRNAVVKNQR